MKLFFAVFAESIYVIECVTIAQLCGRHNEDGILSGSP